MTTPNQPLRGLKIIEFEGIGPGPMAGMMLAELGAEVTVVCKPPIGGGLVDRLFDRDGTDKINRRKRSVMVNLKSPEGVARALALLEDAEALIEGNRPGVMERLGLGPKVCLARNPRLVYGRMTGWGQDGPLAHAAGHDLNYVALTGLLSLAVRGSAEAIVPPTVMGDAAGALGLAFGIACGVLDARNTGRGQVVDAAIVDVVSMLGALVHMAKAGGQVATGQPTSPFYDSPFYDVYRCADGKSITIGALEPQFYKLLLDKLGIDDVEPNQQYETRAWPALKERLAKLFATRSRDAWCQLLEGTDVCFAPVLDIDEAAQHAHMRARGTLQLVGRDVFAASAPRFLEP
jgi:alpha-methylacyl-CoA racemase